jgi:hypothetical protein
VCAESQANFGSAQLPTTSPQVSGTAEEAVSHAKNSSAGILIVDRHRLTTVFANSIIQYFEVSEKSFSHFLVQKSLRFLIK